MMSQNLRLQPEEMRATAGDVERLSGEAQQVQELLQRSWQRLDYGWQSYARENVDGYYRRTLQELARAQQMLEQIAIAINHTVTLILTADKQSEIFFVAGSKSEGEVTVSDTVEPSEDEFDLIEWIKSIDIPWWLELAIGIIPFGDLYDILKELVINQLKGKRVDKLVLSLAILGLIADLGWLNPGPGGEDAPNVGLAFLKTIAKNVPPGPARDAIAEIIEQALKNPDDLKRLGEVSAQLAKNSEIFEVLLKNPEALSVVLKSGPEAVEFATKYGDDAIQVMTKYGDDAIEILHNYSKIADVPGADRLMVDLLAGGPTAKGAVGEIKYAASLGDDIAKVQDLVGGKKAADIVLNDGTIIDVKNWNFDSPWYTSQEKLDHTIKDLIKQVNLRRKQYGDVPIEYVFLCPEEKIPSSIVEALKELGVMVRGADL
jgi:WXG100 family type VII secretion target